MAMLIASAAAETAPSSSAESDAAIEAWGISGSAPQTGSSAHTSGRTFKSNGEQETAAPGSPPEPPASKILVMIDKATQEMKVFVDNVARYTWQVSTGLRGYDTPIGTYPARSMNEIWYSRQWDDAPMPHAIFFTRRGHAIHGTEDRQKLGRPASHGCVRLAPENAATLFVLVKETGLDKTEIVLSGEIPRNQAKTAGQGSQKREIKPAKKTPKTVLKKKKPGSHKTGVARSDPKKQPPAAKSQTSPKQQTAAQQQTSPKQQSAAKLQAAAEPQNKKRKKFESGFDPYAIGSPRRLSRKEWLRLYYSGQARGLPPGTPPPPRALPR